MAPEDGVHTVTLLLEGRGSSEHSRSAVPYMRPEQVASVASLPTSPDAAALIRALRLYTVTGTVSCTMERDPGAGPVGRQNERSLYYWGLNSGSRSWVLAPR